MSLLSLLMVSLALSSPPALPAHEGVTVVVVRHAEKAADDPRDPALSEAGQARARALAATFAGAGLDRAIATQFRRTRDTAAPAAEAAGVAVQVRPITAENAPRYAAELAAELRALPAGSTVLVVGHSNTVPAMVEALSGQAAEPMPETEYDRYTVVLLEGDTGARVQVHRY